MLHGKLGSTMSERLANRVKIRKLPFEKINYFRVTKINTPTFCTKYNLNSLITIIRRLKIYMPTDYHELNKIGKLVFTFYYITSNYFRSTV